jgi:hypothetical protein
MLSGGLMAQVQPSTSNLAANQAQAQSPEEFQKSLFPNGGGALDNHDKYPPLLIDDSRAKATTVALDNDMYNHIQDWALKGKNQTVGLTASLLQKYDSAKVNRFMLKYHSGDSTYFLTPSKGVKSGNTARPKNKTCRCKYLTFSAQGPQEISYYVDPPSPTVKENTPFGRTNNGVYKGSYREAFGAGRAEFNRLRVSSPGIGRRTGRHNPRANEMDAQVQMRIFYLCTDENELPSDCGCDKKIRVEAEFDGSLYTHADGSGTANKNVYSKAEAAVVLAQYTVAEDFTDIDFPIAKMKGAYSTHSTSISPEFVLKIIDIAKSVKNGLRSNGTNVGTGFLDDAVELLEGIIGEDPVYTSTSH